MRKVVRKRQRKIEKLQKGTVDRLLKTMERGKMRPPPNTLVTGEELSKVQSTVTAHASEITWAIDRIGTRHPERLFDQEKMFMERLLEHRCGQSRGWVVPGGNMLSSDRSLLLS